LQLKISDLGLSFKKPAELPQVSDLALKKTTTRNIKLRDTSSHGAISDYMVGEEGELLPVKWVAPEVLEYRKFSSASDVYSLAVVFYEIYTAGPPWPSKTNMEALRAVIKAERMEQPRNCPDSVYKLWLKMWDQERQNRPTYQNLLVELKKIQDQYEETPEEFEEINTNPITDSDVNSTNVYSDFQDGGERSSEKKNEKEKI